MDQVFIGTHALAMEFHLSVLDRGMPMPRSLRHGRRAPWPRWHDRGRRLIALLRRWRRRAYERRLLTQFDARDRRDLALTMADIEREVSKPFWRE